MVQVDFYRFTKIQIQTICTKTIEAQRTPTRPN